MTSAAWINYVSMTITAAVVAVTVSVKMSCTASWLKKKCSSYAPCYVSLMKKVTVLAAAAVVRLSRRSVMSMALRV